MIKIWKKKTTKELNKLKNNSNAIDDNDLTTLVALRKTVMETLTPCSDDATTVSSLNSACSTRTSQSPRILRPRKYFDLQSFNSNQNQNQNFIEIKIR